MAKTFDYEQVLVDLLFCYAANCKDHYQKLYILFYGTQMETNPVLPSVKIKMSTKGVKSIKNLRCITPYDIANLLFCLKSWPRCET